MEQLLIHVPLLTAFVTFGLYIAAVFRNEKRYQTWGNRCLAMLVALTTLVLMYRYTGTYESRFVFGGYEALLFIALSVGVLSLLGGRLTGVQVLPMTAMPIILICLAVATFRVKHLTPHQPELSPKILIGHIIPSLWGYTAFALAFAMGVVYLIQERSLKKRQLGPLFEGLPPLKTLERGIARLLWLGFGLFTVALLGGAIGSIHQEIEAWLLDSKVILAIGTWVVYAVILAARSASLLRGRKVAQVSILGIVMIFCTFIVTETVLPGWHTYGWKTHSAQGEEAGDAGNGGVRPGEGGE
jgi:ABC-type uncharacterized transport system permease subunit